MIEFIIAIAKTALGVSLSESGAVAVALLFALISALFARIAYVTTFKACCGGSGCDSDLQHDGLFIDESKSHPACPGVTRSVAIHYLYEDER